MKYQMQTMDMGSAEAAITQIAALPPSSSSSYFLQLDPSGHIDILDSSLVLTKPDIADETVYEIQLDQFMVDDQKVEMVNLPNFPNSVAFQSELLDEHNNVITTAFNPAQIQYHIDDVYFNQMLMTGGTFAAILPPQLPTPVPIPEAQEMTGVDYVPDFTIETEIPCETEKDNLYTLASPQNEPGQQQSNAMEIEAAATVAQENVKQESECEEESESLPVTSTENDDAEEKPPEKKTTKWDFPEKLWDFTDEPVMPPVKIIYPTIPCNESLPDPPVVTISDKKSAAVIKDEMEVDEPFPSEFLPEGIDPDDELYISYLKRPDESKTKMCILCYEWFDCVADLDAHLNSAHRDNMILYGCKRCGKQFWSRFMRQRHEKMHRYDLKCPIQRYFPKNRPFDHYESNHFLKRLRPAPFTKDFIEKFKLIQSQVKSTEYECIQCDKVFQNEEEYREHYEENHALQTCIHCREVFENAKRLRRHEQDDHGVYQVKNNYAGGAWKLWESEWDCDELKEKDEKLVSVYLYHNYSKRKADDKKANKGGGEIISDQFFINGCQEISMEEYDAAKKTESKRKAAEESKKSKATSKTSGRSHSSSSVDSAKGKKYEPKPAPEENLDETDYFDNTDMPPPGSNSTDLPFKCDTCKTSFDNDPDLQRHIKSHSLRAMAYMCQYCGRGFATHSNRKEHERIHTGDKPYSCPICSRAFVQISNLKKHIQTHKDKNNLQCTTCNKQFVKESSLILHQRAHSQDRKFRCHICDRAYNYASLLKRHMRIHTGENPYSCDDCGMQFHELVSLHYHRKKVHTGERPHVCSECSRAFILSSDLKKHLKIHQRSGTPNSIKPSAKSGKSKNATKVIVSDVSEENSNSMEVAGGATDSNSLTALDYKSEEQSNNDEESKPDSDTTLLNYITADDGHGISDDGDHQVLVISETDLLKTVKNETKSEVITNETKENCLALNAENHVEPIP